MSIFLLLAKLVPYYLMIILGFVAARFLGAQKGSVVKILTYIIVPVVVFLWRFRGADRYRQLVIAGSVFCYCLRVVVVVFADREAGLRQ